MLQAGAWVRAVSRWHAATGVAEKGGALLSTGLWRGAWMWLLWSRFCAHVGVWSVRIPCAALRECVRVCVLVGTAPRRFRSLEWMMPEPGHSPG